MGLRWNGSILGKLNLPNAGSANGCWGIKDQQAFAQARRWPINFTASTVANLALWLDAADASTMYDATSGGSLVAGGGAIARWEDKSGGGYHVTQSTANNRPTRTTGQQNSLDVVRFDGTNDRLINSSISVSQPMTRFVVVKFDNSSGQVAIESYNNTTCFFGLDSSATQLVVSAGNTNNTGTSAANTLLHIHVFNGASSSWQLNGGSSSSINAGANSLSGLSIGDLRGNPNPIVGNYGLQGDIMEVLVYSASLSVSNINTVRDYLNAKWKVY
jgi:hypothetical protein